jgi:hypothetical protein
MVFKRELRVDQSYRKVVFVWDTHLGLILEGEIGIGGRYADGMRQGMTQGRTFLKVPQDHTKSDGSLKYIS